MDSAASEGARNAARSRRDVPLCFAHGCSAEKIPVVLADAFFLLRPRARRGTLVLAHGSTAEAGAAARARRPAAAALGEQPLRGAWPDPALGGALPAHPGTRPRHAAAGDPGAVSLYCHPGLR